MPLAQQRGWRAIARKRGSTIAGDFSLLFLTAQRLTALCVPWCCPSFIGGGKSFAPATPLSQADRTVRPTPAFNKAEGKQLQGIETFEESNIPPMGSSSRTWSFGTT